MVRDRRRVGFTLVELLVVIGIIALLISVLLPALAKARGAALDVVCQSDFRQWGMGIQMYVDQNKGLLPQKGPDGSSTSASNSNFFGSPASGVIGYDDPSIWFNAIPPLVNNKSYYQMLVDDYHGLNPAPREGLAHSIFMCPLAAPAGTQNGNDIITPLGYYLLGGFDSTLTIRNSTGMVAAQQFKFNLSYVFNSKLSHTTGQTDPNNVRMSSLRPTSEVVVMTEKIANPGEYKDTNVQRWAAAHPEVYGSKINANGSNTNIAQSKADWTRFSARHHGGANLLFADGHVAWFAWPDVQYSPSQLPMTPTSDANHPGKILWSAYGPVNSN